MIVRLPARIESDAHDTRGLVRNHLQEPGPDAPALGLADGIRAAAILADGAQQLHLMPQLRGVKCKIEGRASRMFGLPKNIPEHLTDAQDSH